MLLEALAASLLPVKAFCIVTTLDECGFVRQVKTDTGEVYEGVVTTESLASTMLNRTSYENVFILPDADFKKIWESDIWEKDIEFVFRWVDNEKPTYKACKVNEYQFLGIINFDN